MAREDSSGTGILSSSSKRGRKPKKVKPAREFSLDLGSGDGSDDDRWIRRRSERIFLHDAALATPVSPPVLTSASNKPPAAPPSLAPKAARTPKASPQSPKEITKPREIKELTKV